MIGLICALCSIVAALASFMLRSDLVIFGFILASVMAGLAVLRKTRPVFLLLAFLTIAESFVIHPLGLRALISQIGEGTAFALDLGNLLPFTVAMLAGLLFAALCFMLSCRKHPGGARFSAHEASLDIEHLIDSVARLSALFYLPLLILPLYFAASKDQPITQTSLNLVSWRDAPMLAAQPEIQIFVWFGAIIMLGGMAAACVSNVHHRFVRLRQKTAPRMQAWIDICASLFLLLPACWAMAKLGWLHAALARVQAADFMAFDPLIPGLALPQWALFVLFPVAFSLLGLAGLSLILRSLIFLYGPHYLVKRAASHLELSISAPEPELQTAQLAARETQA